MAPSDRDPHRGFTIVELLIVVVVIAILAAITIISYNGISNRAKNSAAASAAEQAAKKVLAYAVINSDQYPSTLGDAGINDSSTIYQYRYDNSTSPKTFCVTATTQTVSYWASNTSATPSAGVCAGHAAAGQTLITNLALNPGATDINYWGTYGGSIGGGATPVSLSIVSAAWAPSGSAARITAASGATSVHAEVGTRNTTLTVPASGEVTASVLMRASTTRPTGYLRLRLTSGGDTTSSNYTVTTTPQRLQITASGLTPGATYGIAYKENGSTTFTPGDFIEASALMITNGATSYSYADGNSAGWAWNGAAGSATSTGPAL